MANSASFQGGLPPRMAQHQWLASKVKPEDTQNIQQPYIKKYIGTKFR
jgi:hypothetical protein